ncbi:MAG: type II toxin-antitoxin system VapC family toxin [Candidatus Micrarchaeota archaeon]
MFLDANVFIHAFDSNGSKHEVSKRFLKRISGAEMKACTSVLVLNEVLYFFSVHDGPEKGVRIFSNLRKMPNLVVLPVSDRDLEHVAAFIQAGLDATDAYHAAVMKCNGIDTICSYDKGFERASGLKRQEPK